MKKKGRPVRLGPLKAGGSRANDGQQRSIYRQGGSWVVAVPWWARRLLSRADGGAIYWHDAGRGAVLLSNSPTRKMASAVLIEMQDELNRLRRDNVRLQRKVGARPLKVLNEGVSQGVGIGVKIGADLATAVAAMVHRLDAIEARLPYRAPRRRAAPPVPPASAPPPSEVVEGEAVAPGEPLPQGHP